MATEVEVRVRASTSESRNPSFEKLRFVNSGTEAVMAALKASRAFTGRAEGGQGRGGLPRSVRLRRGEPGADA